MDSNNSHPVQVVSIKATVVDQWDQEVVAAQWDQIWVVVAVVQWDQVVIRVMEFNSQAVVISIDTKIRFSPL